MKKAPSLAEASPYKSVAEELETLRRAFRGICQRYTERIETEIVELRERVVAAGTVAAAREKANGQAVVVVAGPLSPKPSVAMRNKQANALTRVHELRDMLTLLRTLQLKPTEGRRKDLKKVESVIEDLRLLAMKWA